MILENRVICCMKMIVIKSFMLEAWAGKKLANFGASLISETTHFIFSNANAKAI